MVEPTLTAADGGLLSMLWRTRYGTIFFFLSTCAAIVMHLEFRCSGWGSRRRDRMTLARQASARVAVMGHATSGHPSCLSLHPAERGEAGVGDACALAGPPSLHILRTISQTTTVILNPTFLLQRMTELARVPHDVTSSALLLHALRHDTHPDCSPPF